jgi:O-antigen ligase
MKKARSKSEKPRKGPTGAVVRGDEFSALLLVRSILVAAGVALFLPVVVNGSFYYSSMFLKSILFRVTAQVMLLLYVLLAALVPAYRPRLHRISYAVLAWFGVMFISSLPGVSVSAWSSWYGDFRRMGGMITQLHLLAYFFVLSQTLKRERDWLVLFTASLFSGVLMGFSGLVQYLGLNYLYRFPMEDHIEGAAGNPDFFATSMLFSLFIALWFLGRTDKGSSYALMAKVWLLLLGLLDLFVIGWDLFTGAGITSGLALFPVAVFALILHVASLCWFIMRSSIRAGQVFLVFLGAWCFFWMYQSQTRSTVVGFAGSLLLLCGLYLWTGASRKLKLLCAGLILFALLMPAAILLNRHSSWVQSHPTLLRFTSITLADAAAGNRVLVWKAGARAILDRPLFGWGLENFKNALDFHFPGEVYRWLTGNELWFDRAHDLLVDVGVTTGLIGLATYLGLYGLIITFLVRLWLQKKSPANSIMIVALLLAYLFQGLFNFDTINADIIRYLVLAYSAYLYAEAQGQLTANPITILARFRTPWQGWVLVVAAVIVLPIGFSYTVVQPYQSNRLLRQAQIQTRVRDPRSGSTELVFSEGLLSLFQQADSYQTTGCHDVHEVFANYAYDLAHAPSIPIDLKIRVVRMGVDFLRESTRLEPANARYYLYTASLVNGTLDIVRQADPQLAESLAETTLAMLQKAEVLSPARPQVYFERSQTLHFLGRTEEQLAAVEKGAALSPAFKDPHLDLVNLYIANGRFEDAAKEWQNIKAHGFQLTPEDYDRVISSYNAKKKFAPVVDLYKERLAATPADAEILARLAFAYRDLGEMDLARETARKAATLSPAVAAELQSLLNSLKKPE